MLFRLSFALAAFVLILTSSLQGLAQDLESKADKPLFSFKTDDREPLLGDRFRLKVGYKVWVAKWQAPVRLYNANGPTHGTTDHPSAMHGPTFTGSVTLRDSEWFNSMFFNITSLRDGFDFAEQGTAGSVIHDFAKRRDTTITAGLAIWEGIGIFGGYYHSEQDFNLGTLGVGGTFSSIIRQKRTLRGPIFGVFGTGQVSERVSLYGNIAYALLKLDSGFKPAGSTTVPSSTLVLQTDSAHGYATEFGFNVTGPRIWKIGTELQAGFRAQIINKTFGRDPVNAPAGAIANDITYGPTFAINAVF